MLLAVIVGQSLAMSYRNRDLELFGILLLPSGMAAIVSAGWAAARMRSSPRTAGACVCLLLCYLCLLIYWFVTLSDSGR
jgi:sugar phosphate permease